MTDPDNLGWAVADVRGKIRAAFDSKSEAVIYLNGRGHVYGGRVIPLMSHEEAEPAIDQISREESMENLDEAKKKKETQDAKKRPGICTGEKFGAKPFGKAKGKETKESKELSAQQMVDKLLE